MPAAARAVALGVLCAVALAAGATGGERDAAPDGALLMRDGDTVEVSEPARAAGFSVARGVAPGDRAWILAAVGRARPEAARLIAEVDGLVELRTDHALAGGAIGLTEVGPAGIDVSLDVAALNGEAALQRDTVVLHELGHVVDAALVPAALAAELDAGIPRGGPCVSPQERSGACAEPAERFADTFAKWALRGAVSVAGAGYGVPSPSSLEAWGAPLSGLAAGLDAG